ncbi:hypothetical protein EVAR_48544_1 [Eumeta japonica]|uniref:Uncharacterized protein n=1 Tax=Eumeta variegata TaxID=151549 RepID=A0A4C1YAJ6_EUMVA|nr:hypothetical protein EVAR_48544_1 [Eumeta japonica]
MSRERGKGSVFLVVRWHLAGPAHGTRPISAPGVHLVPPGSAGDHKAYRRLSQRTYHRRRRNGRRGSRHAACVRLRTASCRRMRGGASAGSPCHRLTTRTTRPSDPAWLHVSSMPHHLDDNDYKCTSSLLAKTGKESPPCCTVRRAVQHGVVSSTCVQRTCSKPSEGKCSPPPMETRNLREVTITLRRE